ncbi:MAG TPA: sensor histidine kinase [Bryobacteraceae bacterium]|nr:sensor histidine kinase [Bryobacteraceae bacterium]
MIRERPIGVRLLHVLAGGFTLLILLLAASVFVGTEAMRSAESGAARLVEEQRATLRLIDDIQRNEDSLSAVFYTLAVAREPTNRKALLETLEIRERAIRRTINNGRATSNPHLWSKVSDSAEAFIAEGRRILGTGESPPELFYRLHEDLITVLAELAGSYFDAAAAAQKREMEGTRTRVRNSLLLLGIALLTATAAAIATIHTVRQMFRRLNWQAAELGALSSRTMSDQEETARRFSRELHDEFGQTLSALEANLVAMHNARRYEVTGMEDCLALVKQAIDNARELSQLLRPSILDDFGLSVSLQWLADTFSQRTGVQVSYEAVGCHRLSGETETQLFRIAQEALTNIARHATATLVRMHLRFHDSRLVFTISDDGRGFAKERNPAGLGLVGMRARARTAGGVLKVKSIEGHGVTIEVELPFESVNDAAQNSHLSSR